MLTQLTTVKARLGVTDGSQDELLTRVIEATSRRFDLETGRLLERREGHVREFAAIEQIAFWYQRKDMVGLSRYGISGTYYDNVAHMDLLPMVRSVLARHRRLWL